MEEKYLVLVEGSVTVKLYSLNTIVELIIQKEYFFG
jgi:hypothetical protein